MEDESERIDEWMRDFHARIIQLGNVLDPALWGPVPPAEVYGALRELEGRARRMREELHAVTVELASAMDNVHELVAECDALKTRVRDLESRMFTTTQALQSESAAAGVLRSRVERLIAQRNIAHQNYIDASEALRDRTDALESAVRVIAELAVVSNELRPDPLPVSDAFVDEDFES